ncbi:MAG TPA: hypothetical protein VFZ99_00895, partial [Terriglobales bacterium]
MSALFGALVVAVFLDAEAAVVLFGGAPGMEALIVDAEPHEMLERHQAAAQQQIVEGIVLGGIGWGC